MKHGAALVVIMCASLWVEYQFAMQVGVGVLLVGAAVGLIAMTVALYRAPEAREDQDGLYICANNRCWMDVRHRKFFAVGAWPC